MVRTARCAFHRDARVEAACGETGGQRRLDGTEAAGSRRRLPDRRAGERMEILELQGRWSTVASGGTAWA